MKINASNVTQALASRVESLLASDAGMRHALRGLDLDIGLASDPDFAVPAHAADSAVFVGDEAWVDPTPVSSPMVESLLKTHPERVRVRPVYNEASHTWRMEFKALPLNGDAIDTPALLEGQVFSPWNISYMSRIWQEPLTYSRAKSLVEIDAGSNPWAEIFTLFLEQYAGWGIIGQTGSVQNNGTGDVNVLNGMMSANVINISGTYSLTLDEREGRARAPYGTSGKTRKESYLSYVMDMIDDILILFGNDGTDTKGLFDINPIRSWETGKDLTTLSKGSNPGSVVYKLLAEYINDFLTAADNKFTHIQIAMSPLAYNLLTSMPYSDVYDPKAALRIFTENYFAGKGPEGSTPTIEFIAEPLLKANTSLNPNDFDLMLMQAKSIPAGPKAKQQPTMVYAAPLRKFVYPVIPGMYNSQYKMLRRVAGIICPIPAAVRTFAGFGIQG